MREHWRKLWGEAGFDAAWHAALVAGVVPDSAAEAMPVQLRQAWADGWSPPQGSPVTVTFAPDHAVWDGEYADNAWLQEMPRPLTKIAGAAADDQPQIAAE